MKKLSSVFILILALVLLMTACGGATQTEAPLSAQDSAAPAQADQSANPATEVPALQPINLAGPDVGAFMVWVDGSILVPVPGGDFLMGDGGDDNPEHTVGLSSFWIYRTKVTNRMYAICVATGKCSPPIEPQSLQDFQDTDLQDIPVAGVNWEQADAYCEFVEGRLPTEAEWEKTARGPNGNPYPWGDAAPSCDLLNFGECVGSKSDVFDYPQGKSYYEALDTTGNAFEWVADWYNPQYYGVAPAVNPFGPESGTVRSVRSSSFLSAETDIPAARRFFLKPDETRIDLGFRCVVEAPHQFAPFCQTVYIPGQPGQQVPGQPPDQSSCPAPVLSQGGKGCHDQTTETGWGNATVSGDITSLVSGSLDCSVSAGVVTCTGPENTVGEVAACNQCDNAIVGLAAPANGSQCPPGMYFDGQTCVGDGQPGQCPQGFNYRVEAQCCEAGPGIPYPGCGPGEHLDGQTCVPGGQQPPSGSCTTIMVAVGNCGGGGREGGEDGGDDVCTLTPNSCRYPQVFDPVTCSCK